QRVLTYLKERTSATAMGLGLVVQKLVPAEKSGVLFSVDPVRGCDTEMLIEACFGLGEALVSGHVTPDQYRYDWFKAIECGRTVAEKDVQCVRLPQAPFTALEPLAAAQATAQVLSAQEVAELALLGLHVQRNAGFPVDVEWAKVGDQFFVLQSRPITQLGFSGIPGEWTTADFRDGGVSASVCTPYMASLYKSVMDVTMGDYLNRLGLKPRREREEWFRNFYSRPYWNLEAVKYYLSQTPGFNERTFDQGLGITPGYEGDGIVVGMTPKSIYVGLKALLAIKSSCKAKLKESPAFAEGQKKRLQQLKAMNPASFSDRDLFAFCETFLTQEYFRNESAYFDFIYDNSNLNALFKESVKKLGFDEKDYPLLLGGLSGVSHMMPIETLWKLRDAIQSSPEANRFWSEQDAAEIEFAFERGEKRFKLDLFAVYLDDYGHHSKQELDLMVPRYAEVPGYVIAQLKDVLQQPASGDPRKRNKRQEEQARAARDKLLNAAPFWKRHFVLKDLEQVRSFLWWREELRDLSTQFYFHVRRFTLEVQRRLLKAGVLQAQDDIFFLTMTDLVKTMKDEYRKDQVAALIERNRSYYQSFAGFTIPDEIGERYSGGGIASGETSGDGQIGVAGSPGVVTGTARVIANIHDADRLQPGDILVTRCTDPGWTPKFSLLSGVVTETGGILSHAAVICREYGIPAILAVKKATTLIVDGETITIDGSTGAISVLKGGEKTLLSARVAERSETVKEEVAA
ncbi:MAG TPA: PEP/pyruvate-binding domain-containing protein, partial [Dongiaceae bacterium]|nr:PEP/pyruvate-binding domain-containing protein [Dongiaceae bacterium]